MEYEFTTTDDLVHIIAVSTMVLCFVGGWIAGSFR